MKREFNKEKYEREMHERIDRIKEQHEFNAREIERLKKENMQMAAMLGK